MKRIRRSYLWGSLALLLALVAGVYAFSETLLNDLLRPRLVALAAERLAAEVAVGRLSWRQGVLQIDDLRLLRPDHYALQVPRLRLELRLSDLFERRLSAVAIDSPTLLLQSPSPASASVGGFSSRPPVTIGRLVLHNGRIDYALPERSLTLRQIEVGIDGGEIYRFSLRAELGAEVAVPLQLAGQADWRQGLQLQLERCEWGGRSLLAAPLILTVPAGDGMTGGGRIRLARFDRAAFEQLRRGLQLPALLPDGVDFVLRDAELAFRLAEQQWQLGLKLSEGRLQKDKLMLPVDQLDLALSVTDGGCQGQGTFLLAGANPGELSGRWADGLLQGKLALQVAEPGRLKQQLLGGKALEVAGGLRVAADFSVQQGAVQAKFDLQGQTARQKGKNYLFNLMSLRLQGDLQGPPAELSGQARLLLDGRELLTASGRPEALKLQLHSTSWRQLRQLLGPHLRPSALQELTGFSGNAVLERQTTGAWAVSSRLASRRGVLADLQLDGLSGRLHATSGPKGLWNGRLRLDSRQLSRAGLVLDHLSGNSRLRYQKGRLSFSGLKVTARLAGPGELGGRLALAGSGFWQAERWQARIASLQVQELEWLSADGLAGLAGGRGDVRGQLDGRSNRPLRIDLQAKLAAAEGLCGAYYADLSALPVRLAGRLSWDPAARRLQAEQWTAAVAGIGTAQGRALLSSDVALLAGTVQVPELAGQTTELLGQLLAEGRPKLAEATLAGGLQVDFDLQKSAGWRLRGELRPQRLGLELPALDLVLTGLAGRLPFDLLLAGEEPAQDVAPRDGELRFEELHLGPVQLAPTPLIFAAAPNRLTFGNPLVMEMAEGRIVVADLLLGRVAEGLLLTGRFTIDGVDLQRLTGDLGLAAMRGRLDADLGRIQYREGLLRSEGEARIDAFGGQLRIGSIGLDISHLAYPQLTADLDFQGIDLYQLTQTFSFGAMSGIVDGYVHDLRLFGTTPAKFTALVESRLAGRRNISVKALNNLAILSQGGLSAALSRGVYRFIDFYRYRKIGIACELERDVFHLRGTAYPGSTRYLVHGGALPPKIDIIAPPSAISFSEMLKRLQRIERAD